jgi:uncharacterized protein (DUF952 family)
MRETYHLVPRDAWLDHARADGDAPYRAGSLASEGFVHCTDGLAALGPTFDRHYAADARPFMALTIDLDALDVPWRFDDPGSPYPHIYGPIPAIAIRAASDVIRDGNGRFDGLEPAADSAS